MTEHEERVFEAKAEKYFQGQRELPTGRNFLAFVERFHGGDVQRNYDMGMCRTFPDAPGSRMCGACSVERCDMRHPARLEDYQWVVDRIRAACPDDDIRLWLKDYDAAVMVTFDNKMEGKGRKRRNFYVKTDNECCPPEYNLLALPAEEQEYFIDKQIALWKEFKCIGVAPLEDYQWALDRIRAECPYDLAIMRVYERDNVAIVLDNRSGFGSGGKRYMFWLKCDLPEVVTKGPYDINEFSADERDSEIERHLARWERLKGNTEYPNTEQKGEVCRQM